MTERLKVNVDIQTLNCWNNPDTLIGFIDWLKTNCSSVPIENVKVNWVGGDDYESGKLILYTERDETDEEMANRLGYERQRAFESEQFERAQLARLRAKYG